MQFQATAKYIRVSPQKARLVVDLIRGRSVEQALSILKASTKAVSRDVEKVVQSAVSNAKNSDAVEDVDVLYVREAFVGHGPIMKRFRARARGRASRILKRSCHITVALAEKPE